MGLVKVVGNRWGLLEKLYSEKEDYVSALAKKIEKKTPDVSGYLKELEKYVLVKHEERASPEKGMRKYYSLTDKGKRIVKFFKQYESTKVHSPANVEGWRVEWCLRALDTTISNEETRYKLANAFFELCESKVWEHDRVLEIFMDIVKNPEKFNNKVGERFRAGFKRALRWMVVDEEKSIWVKELFNLVVISAQEKDLNVELRAFFISLLDRFFWAYSEKRLWILKTVKAIIFEHDVEKDSKIFQNGKYIILKCFESGFESNRDEMFNLLLEKVEDSDPSIKEKAEDLIQSFITQLATRQEKIIEV
jgi:DNA-binding PadR family transcriptional regulator